jgi:hypothetical protein
MRKRHAPSIDSNSILGNQHTKYTLSILYLHAFEPQRDNCLFTACQGWGTFWISQFYLFCKYMRVLIWVLARLDGLTQIREYWPMHWPRAVRITSHKFSHEYTHRDPRVTRTRDMPYFICIDTSKCDLFLIRDLDLQIIYRLVIRNVDQKRVFGHIKNPGEDPVLLWAIKSTFKES